MADNRGATSKDRLVSPLPFGIPQLDQLLGYTGLDSSDLESCTETPTSLAIVGSDGTGKSVFGLHVASRYLALLRYRAHQKTLQVEKPIAAKGPEEQQLQYAAQLNKLTTSFPAPYVFYISSDLRYGPANKLWENFYLDYPWSRHVPFLTEQDLDFRRSMLRPEPTLFQVELRECKPAPEQIVKYLREVRTRRNEANQAFVSFLDLATHTTGDDWLFVGRLMASLARGKDEPPNLLIIDSVAGFETLVGERNSYGDRMSRRARVAQLLRAGGQNWHTVFIVEEPHEGDHLPEEYVTDTVVHLRRYGQGAHTRRILEIEKSRARSFGVGEHPFEIRDGRGTSTGSWENPDDPATMLHPDFRKKLLDSGQKSKPRERRPYNSYVQVFPSLHYLSREFARKRVLIPSVEIGSGAGQDAAHSKDDYIPFNIPYLDNMLAKAEDMEESCGLPGSSTTALVGDEGTRKSTLAEHFLAQAFADFPEILKEVIELVKKYKHQKKKGAKDINVFLEKQCRRVDTSKLDRAHKRVREQITRNIGSDYHFYLRKELTDLQENKWDLLTEEGLKCKVEGRLTDKKLNDALSGKLTNKELTGALEGILTEEELKEAAAGSLTGKGLKDVLESRFTEGRPLMTRWDEKFYYKSRKEPIKKSRKERIKEEGQHTFLLALSILRMSWGVLPAVVFISTHDTDAERISDSILKAHRDDLTKILQDCEFDESRLDLALHAVKRLLERFILVRRVELVDATAPQLWHIIHSGVTDALYKLGHFVDKVLDATSPLAYASSVRVVVSDLRLVRDTYPAVADDPLFLPTLTFRLKRFGVTSLIVDSDNGRPDQLPSHPMNGALRSLVDHQIYTWKVPFFGEQRVAIAVIPAMNPDSHGVIRELCHIRNSPKLEPERVTVDPHFELYMGIEEGKPTAVPLQVILYEETKAFTDYIEAENGFFSRVFSPLPGTEPVIQVRKTRDYDGLRDYCHLPVKTHLPFTLVFMIDGYWARGRSKSSSLRSQKGYLLSKLSPEFDDVFQLYRRTLQPMVPTSGGGAVDQPRDFTKRIDRTLQPIVPASGDGAVDQPRDFTKRIDFFSQHDPISGNYYYKTRIAAKAKDEVVDRVPFMWDFGFLLCNEHQWNNAADISLKAKRPDGATYTVGEIWNRLRGMVALEYPRDPGVQDKARPDTVFGPTMIKPGVTTILGQPVFRPGDLGTNVTWREFLEACVAVAEAEERRTGQKVSAFDLATTKPDSFACWMMEMWFSQMVTDALAMQNHANRLKEKKPELASQATDWAKKLFKYLSAFSQPQYSGSQDRPYLQDFLRGERDAKAGIIEESFKSVKSVAANLEWAKNWRPEPSEAENAENVVLVQLGMPGYSFQLYKVWLLMLEVLDFPRYLDPARPFSLKADMPASLTAVAARHWYKTACTAGGPDLSTQGCESVAQTKVPVRLPGHFATRGDWFLGVATGSRSSRLADQALDMLTSRRANRTRLHLGMGLPTRDLLEGRAVRDIRTGLTISTPDAVHYVSYGNHLDLGGKFVEELKAGEPEGRAGVHPSSYFWFYRTGFTDYDRHAIALQKWIHRLLAWTDRYRDVHRASWRDHTGFRTYDEVRVGNFTKAADYDSFLLFANGLDILAEDLDHSSLSDDPLKL